ncbi:MAG: amino acid adenylation domain-containing protein [Pyrinomonadaceae bacterium]
MLTQRDGLAAPRHGTGNIVDLLRLRAEEQPDRRLYTFLAEGEAEEESLTYAELDRRARGVGAWLEERGAGGERVLLLFPPGLGYIAAFFGCLYAGAVAVPAYPPRRNRGLDRLRAIVADARPALALTTLDILAQMESRRDADEGMGGVRWAAIGQVGDGWAGLWRRPELDDESLAFLQYTSGSTARPKGVMVSHSNLLHNERLIQRAFGQTSESVIVGWLPLFHDMGLIGNVLQPLFAGARCVLLSPNSFLQRPLSWLEAISRHRGTTSGGPNFAYDLCARKVTPEQASGLDLSSWEVAFNGSERVRSETLERFCAAFEPSGFRRRAFFPCYGLAEATLFVSGGPALNGPEARDFQRAALEENYAAPAEPGESDARRLVSCGDVALGQEVRIVEPETRAECAPGRVGEVWVAGASVAHGYWGDDAETERSFGVRLVNGEGTYLRTGDLGFLADGRLYITGRLKDLIIIRGRNYYPEDFEQTVGRCDSALRPGEAAVFSADFDGEERLLVVHEVVRGRDAEGLGVVVENIRRAVAEEHDLQVYAVALVKPGSLLKTSSGKVRRGAMRDAFLAGSLQEVLRWQLSDAREAGYGGATGAEPEDLAELLKAKVASVLGVSGAEIDAARPIVRYGLDSLAAMELSHAVEAETGVALPLTAFLHDASVNDIAEQVAALRGTRDDTPQDPAPAAHEDARGGNTFALSHGQSALWFLHRLAPDSAAYNVVGAARVSGELDVDALRRAFAALAERHPLLRVTFESRGGDPAQVVRDDAALCFVEEDAAGLDEAGLNARVAEEARRPFDLERGPVFRVTLLTLAGGERLLIFSAHHIVTDLWSQAVLVSELGAAYAAEVSGESSLGPAPAADYADYVRGQRAALAGERGVLLREFWRRQLAGELPVLNLNLDFPRPPVQTYEGASESLTLDPETAARLRELARRSGTTLYTVLLAAYQALLHRHTGQNELLVGTPTSGRHDARFQRLVGYFVNPVVVRSRLDGDPSFRQFLARARAEVLEAFEHQDYPFPLLVEELCPSRDMSRSPVFQTTFVFESAPAFADPALTAFVLGERGARLKLGPLALESVRVEQRIAQFDLSMVVAELGGGLAVSLQYNRDLFKASTVRRLLGHFRALAEAVAGDPERPVSEIPLLTEVERRQLLVGFNDTRREFPADRHMHRLFERQARKTPGAVALVSERESLTYRELNERANRLAHQLRAHGVTPEARVGVMLERSPDLVVSLLAVLKAGGAYVPLDPAYPAERLSFMLEDTGAQVIVSRQGLANRLPGHGARVLDLDAEPEAVEPRDAGDAPGPTSPDNLAYIIYTSGSTGRPKGVAIEHRSAVNFIHWALDSFSPEELTAVFASTSVCFDLSVFELFVPLSCGGTIVLGDDALHLATHPEAARITLVNTVPSAMAELLRLRAVGGRVRVVNLAGEALKNSLAQQVYADTPARRVLNLYGPSEYTTYTTGLEVERGAEREPTVGRPVANTRVYVLDDGLRPVPVGVVGEVCVGGPGLARGYLNRPSLTAERFVPDPFAPEPGARLYKTGDLARYRENGEIEYLGRKDHQVKIRGYRIELGEIEAALLRYPGVTAAVVVAADERGGGKRLVAYFVAEPGQNLATGELRDYLRQTLPDYMTPQTFVRLDALPMTRNGKVDRKALPAPDATRLAETRGAVRPGSQLEEVLAGVWAETLGLEQFGADENFFELGGHSLKAVRVVSRVSELLGAELPVRALFEAPTLRGFAGLVERAAAGGGPAAPPVEPAAREGDPPASFAQRRLWFLQRLRPDSTAYNLASEARFRADLNVPALAQGLNEVVRRQESLRTTFAQEGAGPAQIIAPRLSLPLPVVDLRRLSAEARERLAGRLTAEAAARPFDLERGPLLRAALLRTLDDEWTMSLSMHHIVTDGWSSGVLARELTAHYEAFAAGTPSALPEPRVQYADFAEWQRRRLEDEGVGPLLSYWKERLGGAPALLELPTDRPRPPARSERGAALRFELPRELVGRLEKVGRAEGATLFMTLLAGFQLLLSRYSGQTDISVGTPIANRARPEVEALIGCFANTLVMRTDLSGDPTFAELLGRVRETALGAYTHQDAPFEQLVTELRAERDLSRTPLFQVALALQNTPADELRLSGLPLLHEETENGTAKFDMTVQLTEEGGGLRGRWEYSTDLFDAATVARMAEHFRTLLEAAADDPARRVSELPLQTPAERRRLLTEWDGEAERHAQLPCLHELFERQAERAPDAAALVCGDERVSYGELNERANRLANHLRAFGVGPESRVGILLERSAEMVVAMLAAVKTGGAYVPLDPTYPAERIAYVLEDSGAAAVLTDSKLAATLPAETRAHIVRLDEEAREIAARGGENPGAGAAGANLAYVIYTSGSTGRPKGVLVTHDNVTRLFAATRRWFDFDERDVWTLFHSFAFDFSVWEIWGALLHGGRLVVVPYWVSRSPEDFYALLARERVTVLNQTPSAFYQLVRHEESWAASGVGTAGLDLRLVIFGGEALEFQSLRPWVERHGDERPRLVNMYGITETTVHVTYRPVLRADVEGGAGSRIGQRIGDLRLYVLDGQMEPAPLGVGGELYVGGAGLARGYHGRPGLTAERFIPDPFSQEPGARLYRTGDTGRRLSDGDIEYLGRCDQQVKIQGFRIELGEVEAALAGLPGVRAAAVVVREGGDGRKYLAGYVAGDGASTAQELRAHLQARLPGYMIPATLTWVERFELTPNGKIDRRALPEPERETDGRTHVAPRTPAERALAEVWERVLGVERVGVDDNFFDLGGDSILSIHVVAAARRAGLNITPQQLFQQQTLARLALAAEQSVHPPAPDVAEADADADEAADGPRQFPGIHLGEAELEELAAAGAAEDIYPLTPLQQGMLFHVLDAAGAGLYLNQQRYLLRGRLDAAAFRDAFQRVMNRHHILRTAFFISAQGEPLQVVYGGLSLPWAEHDLRGLAAAEREGALAELLAEDAAKGFELREPPLMRLTLVRLEDDLYKFVWSFHLMLLDGWSVPVILEELLALYEEERGGRPAGLEPPPRYRDYVEWLQGQCVEQAEAHWRRALAGFAAPTPLGTDRAVPGEAGGAEGYAETISEMNEAATERLRAVAAGHKLTLNTFIQGAWALLLSRRSGTGDVLFGGVVSGRPADFPRIDSAVGMFLNTLPVRVRITPESPVLPWLASLQERQAEARRFEFCSLVDVQGWGEVPRGLPLFESVLIFQNIPVDVTMPESEGLRLVGMTSTERTNYPLTLVVTPGARLNFKLVYDHDRFDDTTAERVMELLRHTLDEMAADPEATISSVLSARAEAERRRLIDSFNQSL